MKKVISILLLVFESPSQSHSLASHHCNILEPTFLSTLVFSSLLFSVTTIFLSPQTQSSSLQGVLRCRFEGLDIALRLFSSTFDIARFNHLLAVDFYSPFPHKHFLYFNPLRFAITIRYSLKSFEGTDQQCYLLNWTLCCMVHSTQEAR